MVGLLFSELQKLPFRYLRVETVRFPNFEKLFFINTKFSGVHHVEV